MALTYDDCATLFKALGDETRLKIFGLLGPEEVCACDILEQVDITQPTLSHHMKVLTNCGLVNARKDGSWMRYTVNEEYVTRMQNFLEARKTGGQTDKNSCC